MDYELLYSSQAERLLDGLSLPLLTFVQEHLDRLAADPVGLSQPGAFPHPPWLQRFHFDHPNFDGNHHFFTVLFNFGQDEKTLQVVHIVHQKGPPDPGDTDPEDDPGLQPD